MSNYKSKPTLSFMLNIVFVDILEVAMQRLMFLKIIIVYLLHLHHSSRYVITGKISFTFINLVPTVLKC